MALARTNLHGSVSAENFGAGAYTTSSFTPPSSSLLVVAIGCMEITGGGGNPGAQLTVSGGGWTYTSRALIDESVDWAIAQRIFTAPVTTGASMTLTIDAGTKSIHFYGVAAVAYTGYDTGSPTGGTGTFDDQATPDGAQSLTLSGAPASGSEVLAALTIDKESVGVTPGSAFTELYDLQTGGSGGIEVQIRTGSTSTTVDWVDVHTGGVGGIFKVCGAAVEIKAAGGAVSADSALAVTSTQTATATAARLAESSLAVTATQVADASLPTSQLMSLHPIRSGL